jgi:hypothetical protein
MLFDQVKRIFTGNKGIVVVPTGQERDSLSTMSFDAGKPAYIAVEQWEERTGMNLPEFLRDRPYL